MIFHENDGEEVARFLRTKLSDDNYKCRVSLVEIGNDDSEPPCDVTLSILLLTPELKDTLNYCTDGQRLNSLFPSPRLSVVIRHSVDEDDDIHTTLASHVKGFELWHAFNLGITRDDFKTTTINIMELVDKPPLLKQFSIIPKKIYSSQDDICIIFKREVQGNIAVWVNEDKAQIRTKQVNPFTFTFRLKGLSPGNKHVDVFENNHSVGRTSLTFLSKLASIESLLYDVNNPQELLCQVLRVDDPADLDLELCDILTNGKQNVESLHQLGNVSPSATVANSRNELPTLLHFGAKFGLRGFCNKLLKHPGAQLALSIKNKHKLSPSQLARQEGFPDLGEELEPFLPDTVFENEPDGDYVDMSGTYLEICPPDLKTRDGVPRTQSLGTIQETNKFQLSTVRPVQSLTTLEGNNKYQKAFRHGMLIGSSNTSNLADRSHDSSVSNTSHCSSVSQRSYDSGVFLTGVSERVSLMMDDFNWIPPPTCKKGESTKM
ncbi:hypothetical protein ScPMuIL_004537 [Solemya velum]